MLWVDLGLIGPMKRSYLEEKSLGELEYQRSLVDPWGDPSEPDLIEEAFRPKKELLVSSTQLRKEVELRKEVDLRNEVNLAGEAKKNGRPKKGSRPKK